MPAINDIGFSQARPCTKTRIDYLSDWFRISGLPVAKNKLRRASDIVNQIPTELGCRRLLVTGVQKEAFGQMMPYL